MERTKWLQVESKKKNCILAGAVLSATLLSAWWVTLPCHAYAAEVETETEAQIETEPDTEEMTEYVMQTGDSDIEMSTAYPGVTVKAGETVSFNLDFQSLSGEGYDASLSVASMPEGWEGYFRGDGSSNISRVHISGDEENGKGLATFQMTLPEETQDGTYTVILKADAGEEAVDELELQIDVNAVESGQSSFTSEYPQQQGAAGTSFSFDTTLINNRGTAQSYSLSAKADSGWQVSFTPSGESAQVASVEVEAGTSQGITVAITPPETLKEGEYTISCSAISADETLTTDLTVKITGSYDVAISTPNGRLSFDAYANEEQSVTLSVTNNGNVDLTNLNLTSSAPSDWEVRFDESTIDLLEAGGTKEITAYVTPDKDAMTGDYVTTITVSNNETTDTAQFRVSVKTKTTWGVVAVAAIVALIAILAGIFKKYGRR